MNTEYIQNSRYKLEKRVKRLNKTALKVFQVSLRQFLSFLTSHPLFLGILEDLERRYASMKPEVDKIVKLERHDFDNELEHAAASYFVLKKCAEHPSPQIAAKIGGLYGEARYTVEGLEYFKSFFLQPLYEYLDEQIDEQRAILALLRRYKHKCEWFQQDYLFNLWKDHTEKGEKLLQRHLYEYLHDQGLDFVIEPSSASGEVDLIADQKTDDPLIADTKIFNPEKGKGIYYITAGFHQIYQYTLDYNEPFGYLIIYNTSGEDLKFALTSQEQSTPFVIHNNKTIFIVSIDIFPYETTASKRGPLKTVEITEADLIQVIKAEKNNSQ
jgi:hypothetical protein